MSVAHAADSDAMFASDTRSREKARTEARDASAWALYSVLACAFLVRIVWLRHYPAVSLDEGLWSLSAKNYVLYGDWFLDGHTHVFLSPLFHALEVAVFSITTPSLVGARAISAVAGTVSVWLMWDLVRLTSGGRRDLAMKAAILFAFSQWAMLSSREAMIEPLELCAILATVLLLQRDDWRSTTAAGAVLALALLTKINAAFIGVVLAVVLVAPVLRDREGRGHAIGRIVVFGGTAIVLAGVVYGLLARSHPDLFRRAFMFELDGAHFQSGTHPIVRLGRFGIDPVQISRTLVALLRREPFLMVLSVLGVLTVGRLRTSANLLFGVWLGFGLPYFLGQIYQPPRYFYLLVPAIVYFAALFLQWIADLGAQLASSARSVPSRILAFVTVLNLAYAGVGFIANRERRTDEVLAWTAAHTRPSDRILSSALFTTDLPNRAYDFYPLVRKTGELQPALERFDIDYVLVDVFEWPVALREEAAKLLHPVASWPFGTIYQVNGPARIGPSRLVEDR